MPPYSSQCSIFRNLILVPANIENKPFLLQSFLTMVVAVAGGGGNFLLASVEAKINVDWTVGFYFESMHDMGSTVNRDKEDRK